MLMLMRDGTGRDGTCKSLTRGFVWYIQAFGRGTTKLNEFNGQRNEIVQVAES